MITVRKSNARGLADHGWLRARHTFSFAEYDDPAYMGYSVLRVINDDVIAPGRGFGMHPHRDMEIVTYVLEGELRHEDSMGNGSVIRAGDVQYMSAGKGVRHSEFNASSDMPLHLLQIWILPAQNGLVPQYGQMTVPDEEKRGKWRVLASHDGREGSMTIRQDACLMATLLDAGEQLDYHSAPDRSLYLHMVCGSVMLHGKMLNDGDGAFIANEVELNLKGNSKAETLLFDLPFAAV